MRPIGIAIAVVMSTFAARPCAAADAHADNRIIVRTYDSAALPAGDRARAIDVAHAILGAAGLDIRWIRCGVDGPAGADEPCAAPLGSNEVAVRFVPQAPAPPSSSKAVALGYSLIDKHAPFAALATIYVEPAAHLAEGCHVPWTTVLGRAVAHEIGHLLLGTSDHEAEGLMRALWTRRMLEQNRDNDFLFTAADVRALHMAVSARNASSIPAQIVWTTR